MIDIHTLNKKLLPELKEIAKDLGVPRYQKLKKQELVYEILDVQAKQLSVEKKSEEAKKKEKNNNKTIPTNKILTNLKTLTIVIKIRMALIDHTKEITQIITKELKTNMSLMVL